MAKRCEITGKGAMFGNNVSHAQNKTKRRFNVNLQEMSIASNALGVSVKLRIAMSTLRSIDHNGGLDSYLLNTSDRKLSDLAIALKRKIKKNIVASDKNKANDKNDSSKQAA